MCILLIVNCRMIIHFKTNCKMKIRTCLKRLLHFLGFVDIYAVTSRNNIIMPNKYKDISPIVVSNLGAKLYIALSFREVEKMQEEQCLEFLKDENLYNFCMNIKITQIGGKINIYKHNHTIRSEVNLRCNSNNWLKIEN